MSDSTTRSSAARARPSIFDWPAKRGCTRCSRTVCARCSQGTPRSRKCWKQPGRQPDERRIWLCASFPEPTLKRRWRATSNLSLLPREERAGREPERGAIPVIAPPLPGPLLPRREERERLPRNWLIEDEEDLILGSWVLDVPWSLEL